MNVLTALTRRLRQEDGLTALEVVVIILVVIVILALAGVISL